MSYRDTLVQLADDTERQALTIYSRFLAGELSRDETVAYLAAVIARGNAQAVTLADLALASELMVQLGEAVPVTGTVLPSGDTDRLTRAASTVLVVAETSPVPDAIVSRLARSEPLETAAKAYSQGMSESKLVRGWVRQKSANACQLCQWWWRDGRVWPASHPMPTHKGCTCTPKPVVRDDIQQLSYTKRGQSYDQYRAGLDRRAGH
ncbi:hypothetical protein FOS14_06435 [Skermania sp. ID1734]|uniref:hypothetical protein n=1 Tax=Skermania sp. ID1734 TaxID=2597516 RepID=UPI00117CE304|nr:hypothetical protein [Skermania sp. ID1734]TSE00663.1 hypothetical protein FOS14_06435 [Skermania sp. ID1734]